MTELFLSLVHSFELGGIGYYIAMGIVFLGATFHVELYKAIGSWHPWPHQWYVRTAMAFFIILFAFTPWVNVLTIVFGLLHWGTTWADVRMQRRVMKELDAAREAFGIPKPPPGPRQ